MITYGERCNKDSDCLSNICQHTGGFNERKCIIQQPKYGKPCNYNTDCTSNRCVSVDDINGKFVGKKCAVIDNLKIPETRDIDLTPDPKYVPYSDDPEYKEEMKGILLTDTQKKLAFGKKGPIVDVIVLAMEFVLFLWKDLFLEFLKSIFRFFLVMWSIFPFGFFKMSTWMGFSKKYKDSDEKCKINSITISSKFQTILIAILFPPLGVFFDRGISGLGHVFITMVLTTMMYIPGLTYAINIINETVCPNSIVVYEQEEFKGPRHVFKYGDYSMRNSEKLQSMRKCAKKGWVGVENFANIQSIKIGKNVNVEFYEDENFSDKITTVIKDESKLIEKFYVSDDPHKYVHINCQLRLDEKKDIPKIGALSIVLKEPNKIEPETLNPNSVYFYLLNNYRGKYLELKEGDYNYDELTKIFDKRISSIRIGSNMMVKLFEDDNYNRELFVDFSFGGQRGSPTYFNTNGGEKIYMGNRKYDGSQKPGEIKVIKDAGLYDNTRSIMVRPIHESKSPDQVFEEAEPIGQLKKMEQAFKEDVYEKGLRDTVYNDGLRKVGEQDSYDTMGDVATGLAVDAGVGLYKQSKK